MPSAGEMNSDKLGTPEKVERPEVLSARTGLVGVAGDSFLCFPREKLVKWGGEGSGLSLGYTEGPVGWWVQSC